MNRRGLSLLEILVIVIVIAILAALLLPTRSGHGHRRPGCARNLQQLYKLGMIYAAQHQGQWPDYGDENLWVAFTHMKSPLIERDHLAILACPLRDEEPRPGETDYMAPNIPWNLLAPTDPVAADRPDNHGDDMSRWVVLKNGDVVEIHPGDPLWSRCAEILR